MSEKRSKYDTDPLDPDFLRRTEEISGATRPTTAYPPPEPPQEEPTRRFNEGYTSYPSVFVPPAYEPPPMPPQGYTTVGTPPPHQPPVVVTPPPAGPASPYQTRPTSRPVAGLNLPENIANVLPYAPFYIGLVASLIELLLVPRHETRTRFHAAQGLALHLAIIALKFVFSLIGSLTDSRLGGRLLGVAAFVFLIVSMVRVWKGKPHHIAPLDDATKYLNERIEARKQ